MVRRWPTTPRQRGDCVGIRRTQSGSCGSACVVADSAGWKFKRQVPIDRFIVDFVCADAKLIVELDGGQHAVRTPQDEERTKDIGSDGISRASRFWNNDVMRNHRRRA